MNSDCTINLGSMDFDRPYICSETLSSGNNIYCCCTCGKFFKGRQENSPAYEHSIHTQNHFLFLNLVTGLCFRLPQGEEVDSSDYQELNLLKENLTPTAFSLGLSEELHDLQGSAYFRGFIPIWSSSLLLSCSISLITHIIPIAHQLIKYEGSKSEKLQCLSNVIRKQWMTRPLLRNRIVLSSDLSASKVSYNNAVAHFINGLDLGCLQGDLRISRVQNKAHNLTSTTIKFNQITVDLPPEPLFPDPTGRLPIPQVHLEELINQKYNSGKVFYDANGNAVAYDIIQLPDYLLISVLNRHKNKTVVLFDPNQLNVLKFRYHLIGNLALSEEERYSVQIRRGEENNFFALDERQFKPIPMDHLVLYNCCFQVWKKS
jgi:U4/U6.U5 tri-snRNP-associated protein 2